MTKMQCIMAGTLLVSGLGLTQTMFHVNDWREKHGTTDEEKAPVCCETVGSAPRSDGE